MTRRGEGQKRGPAGSEKRERRDQNPAAPPQDVGCRCDQPARPRYGTRGPPASRVSRASLRVGRAQKPPARERGRHNTAADSVRETWSNSHERNKAGGLEGVGAQWAGQHGLRQRGRCTQERTQGSAGRERGRLSLQSVRRAALAFLSPPSQPTPQFCMRSRSSDSASHNDNRTHSQALI